MKDQIDPADGGLMFCFTKRGEFMAKSDPRYANWEGCSRCGSKTCNCNGMLLSTEQVVSSFATRSNKAKKAARERGEKEKGYSESRGRVDQGE